MESGDGSSESTEQTMERVMDLVCGVLRLSSIDTDRPLVFAGLDSIAGIEVAEALSVDFDCELPPGSTIFVTHRTVRALAILLHSMRRGPSVSDHATNGTAVNGDGREVGQELEGKEGDPFASAGGEPLPSPPAREDEASEGMRGKGKRGSKGSSQQRGQRGRQQPAIAAAKAGDLVELRRLASGSAAQDQDQQNGPELELDPEAVARVVGEQDKHGLGALQWAAGGGYDDCVRFLVDQCGASTEQRAKDGRTAIMWACRNGHLPTARLLVDLGADPKAVSRKGVGCVHWAAWGGQVAVAEWLVDHIGLSLEFLSHAGCNAAIWASAAGHLDMCKWLKSRGANFGHINYWGHGVANKAAWKGRNKLMEWMFDDDDIGTEVLDQLWLSDPAGRVPLDLATIAGHGDTVQLLKGRMQLLDPQQSREVTPAPVDLEAAATHRQSTLEAAGVDPKAALDQGTILMLLNDEM